MDVVGFDALKEHLLRWFPLVDKPRTIPIERQNQWEPDHDQLLKEPHVELLRGLPEVETHLIITSGARKTLAYETTTDAAAIRKLADVV